MYKELKYLITREIYGEIKPSYVQKLMLRDALNVRAQGFLFRPILTDTLYKKLVTSIYEGDTDTKLNIKYAVYPGINNKNRVIFPRVLTAVEAEYYVKGIE